MSALHVENNTPFFDIDGTLLLTGGAVRIAFERIFMELFGVSGAWRGLVPDGKTDPLIIHELIESNLQRAVTPKDFDEIRRRYLIYFEEELGRVEKFCVMPGVAALMPDLAAQAHLSLGVATGNFERPAWLKLERAGLQTFFCFGGFGEESHGRPGLVSEALRRGREFVGGNVLPENVFVVGDTIHDIEAGWMLGLRTIGVATGTTPLETLKEAKADAVLPDLTDKQAFFDILNR